MVISPDVYSARSLPTIGRKTFKIEKAVCACGPCTKPSNSPGTTWAPTARDVGVTGNVTVSVNGVGVHSVPRQVPHQ